MGQRITYRARRIVFEEAIVHLEFTEEELARFDTEDVAQMVSDRARKTFAYEPVRDEVRVEVLERENILDEWPLISGFSEWKNLNGERLGNPGGRRWAVFGAWANTLDDEQLLIALEREMEGWNFDTVRMSGGPGQRFADAPRVAKRTNTRVLVTQRVGLDI
jgi:hypothetical protein